jgi:hypothetical protein
MVVLTFFGASFLGAMGAAACAGAAEAATGGIEAPEESKTYERATLISSKARS